MKIIIQFTVFLTALIFCNSNSFAMSSSEDSQHSVIFTCEPVVPQAEVSINLTARDSGTTGLIKIEISRTHSGKTQSEVYLAEQDSLRARPGAPTVYKTRGLQLTINFSIPTADDGTRPGALLTALHGVENLKCTQP
jgi:hypothetical protein